LARSPKKCKIPEFFPPCYLVAPPERS